MDLAIVSWVTSNLHTPFLDWLMPFFTRIGDLGVIWIVVCALLLLFKKTRRWGMMCALALFLVLVAGELGLKHLIRRERPFTHLPDLVLLIPPSTSRYSFPSVHTMTAFASASVLCFMDKRVGRCALALGALIAFSRLYLGEHYLTDLLAGLVLGVACAYAARWLCDRYLPRKDR